MKYCIAGNIRFILILFCQIWRFDKIRQNKTRQTTTLYSNNMDYR